MGSTPRVAWEKFYAVKDVACDFVLARNEKNLCSSSFFDFRMTIECAACF